MYIYALYNKKVGFYNPPTFSQMDQESTKVNLYRWCMMQQVEARKAHYDECELYYLGKFDDIKCTFELLEKPDFILDLSPAFNNEVPGHE